MLISYSLEKREENRINRHVKRHQGAHTWATDVSSLRQHAAIHPPVEVNADNKAATDQRQAVPLIDDKGGTERVSCLYVLSCGA